MKKTISTKDGTHKWEDAREGDFVVINKARHEVTRGVDGVLTARPSIEFRPVVMHYWQSIGAYLERDEEEHPNGLLPTEEHAIVLCGGDAYQRTFWGGWRLPGQEGAVPNEELQQFADAHGFTRLVPETEVEEARAEGRKQAIRHVYPDAFEQDGGEQA